jgi:hypothetical protein
MTTPSPGDSKSHVVGLASAAVARTAVSEEKDPAAGEKAKIKAAWAIFDKEKKGFLVKE